MFQWVFWRLGISAKKVPKPTLQIITTTARFLLQDFHKTKNFYKLINFAEIGGPGGFPNLLQDLQNGNNCHKNKYTCGKSYLSTLCCYLFVENLSHGQTNSGNAICHFLHVGSTVCFLFPTLYFLLSTIYCLLSRVYYLLSTVYLILFTVNC